MKQGTLFGDPVSIVDDAGRGRNSGRGRPAAKVANDAPPCIGSLSCDADPGRDEAPCPGGSTPPSASLPEPAGPRSKAARIVALAQQGVLTHEERGELDTLLGREINTASTKQMRAFLYDPPPAGCGFKPHYIKERGRNTTKLASDVGTLLSIFRTTADRRAELCLLLSDRLTQLELLGMAVDRDGRVRTSLSIAGSEVGRMASYKSNTGSGMNLHTVPPRHRSLFTTDPGFDFYQIDLKSADTWTVACECAALGDATMLDDLRADLKQAKVVALMYHEGAGVNKLPRDEIARRCSLLPKDWLYAASKRVVHGSNYGMGDVRMAEQILEDSWKGGSKLATITAAQCKRLQALYFARYPGVQRWQERVRMLLKRDGYLTAASGLRRDFFGRKDDHQTQKDAYPFCPAANTAHATNLALLKLWSDPEREAHQVQPLLTVHDSVLLQAPKEHRAWVQGRIPQWFANPLTVAGTTFTIPYECCRGDSWGSVKPL